MAAPPRGRKHPIWWPIGPVLLALIALITAAVTCEEIERRTESVDPMYQEDEVDVMVDYGATLQAQELTAQAGGPEKAPADAGEDVPDLPAEEQPPADEAEPPPAEPEEAEPPPVVDFAGSWHSAMACEEQDAPYRWQVSLTQDPNTHYVSGTISFHACPGGGRATYNVSGTATTSDVLFLEGTKTDGRGDLNTVSPAAQTFRITKGGEPFPNFAP
jgi:hypothetical protein